MNRRGFLTKLGVGAAAVAAAPLLLTENTSQTILVSSNLTSKEMIRLWRQTGILMYDSSPNDINTIQRY